MDVGFEPSMDANKNYSFSLPLLAVDTYVVSWTIMGDDGHKMKGQLSFMVHVSKKNERNEAQRHEKYFDGSFRYDSLVIKS